MQARVQSHIREYAPIVAHVLVVAFATCGLGRAAELSEINSGARFSSPDSRWIAECVGKGESRSVDAIHIVNTSSGWLAQVIEIRSPLSFVGWTGDSKNIAIVEQIAGGSVAAVFHLEEGNWKGRSADPREGNKFHVANISPLKDKITVEYKILTLPKETSQAQFYLYLFTFDPRTTAHEEEKRTPITSQKYMD